MTSRSLRVVYFGTFREEYARNQMQMEGLRRAGIEVLVCHRPLWLGMEDRLLLASGGWRSPAFWLRTLRTYAGLIADFRRLPDFDVLVIGYPGHYDVFLAWLLSRLRRKPLAWDLFNSVYLMSRERGLQQRSPFTINLLRRLEAFAVRLPERMFLDTPQFIAWFEEQYQADPARFRTVAIGADDRYFQPRPETAETQPFTVLYYGGYIPNHGIETVIQAAYLLRTEIDLQFKLIGDGPTRPAAIELARQLALDNLTFIDWLNREQLAEHIAGAGVVLGAFSNSEQLSLTNNNKIYEAFAMQKAVISARSPAIPAVVQHGESLYLVERADPHSLAQAVLTLNNDPELRAHLAKNGRKLFEQHFNPTAIGQIYAQHLRELVQES